MKLSCQVINFPFHFTDFFDKTETVNPGIRNNCPLKVVHYFSLFIVYCYINLLLLSNFAFSMMEEATVCEDEKRDIKICEAAKRDLLFSDEDLESALNGSCFRSKESYSCPNKMRCCDIFTRSEGPIALRRLRSLIWLKNPHSDLAPTLGQRRSNFVNLLKSMSRTKENRILFCFEGKMVCKSYFRVIKSSALCIFVVLFLTTIVM